METPKVQKKRRRKCCVVCTQKSDVALYQNVLACMQCKVFYWRARLKARNNKKASYKCKEKGNCKIRPEYRKKCGYCRLKTCIDVGFPNGKLVQSLLCDATVKTESEEPKSPKITISVIPVNTGTSIEKAAGVKMVTEGCNTDINLEQDVVQEELPPLKSPEGSEKKHKKSRAFKELLKTKQEKSELVTSAEDEPTTSTPLLSPVQGSVEDSPSPGAPGPRIKHVCRNAAVVLGKPLARFPEKSELRLSALPTKDKVQLWKKDEESRAAVVESDDDRPMDEIIQKSPESVVIVKKSPSVKLQAKKKLTGVAGLRMYKRKMRCKKCPGCLVKDCGKCKHCLDKTKFGGPDTIRKACIDRPKFGGRGVLKKGCIKRVCSNPLIRRNTTSAFINPKDSGTESNADSLHSSPDKSRIPNVTVTVQKPGIESEDESLVPGAENSPVKMTGLESQAGTLVEDQIQAGRANRNQASGIQVQRLGRGSEVRALDFDSLPTVQLERVGTRRQPGKISSKLMKKQEFQQKFAKAPGNAACDINSVWTYGLALTMSAAMSVRALCFLCGSAGKHELIYCSICCEPFHEFCLEEDERPTQDHFDDWCCSKCQYCHVCGRQNHLLQCDRCQNTYHPGCLGPNYPTRPSKKKNIWVCTKCVKCKSCGATTPGSSSKATWTYDFSLCYECGLLMDKGNFCPICHKCYSDDDWESKMIQCNMCESWVHSRCEGLTDEMYEILSYLPEDLSFYCRNCHPHGCPEWERTLKHELQLGLESILHTLILTKSAQYILKHEKMQSPQKIASRHKPGSSESPTDLQKQEEETTDSAGVKHNNKHTDKSVVNIVDLTDTKTSDIEKSSLDGGTGCENLKDTGSNVCKTEDGNLIGEISQKVCEQDTNVSTKGKSVETDKGTYVERRGSEQVCDIENRMEVDEEKETKSICDKSLNVCDSNREMVEHVLETEKEFVGHSDTAENHQKTLQEKSEERTSCEMTSRSILKGCKLFKGNIRVMHAPGNTTTQTKGEVDTELLIQKIEKSKSENEPPCEFKVDGSEMINTCVTVSKSATVLPKKTLSVHFKEDDSDIKREKTPEFEPEEIHPKDLMSMAGKMKEGCYKSVAVFCEDILRIIQEYLDNEAETRSSRKKAVVSARSIFVKQMEKIFPWFKVRTCRYWFSNRNMPFGMLPDATLPPNTDHTYAQWLERAAPPMSPQPSPFKRRAATPVKKLMPLDEDEGDMQTLFEGEDMRKCMFCVQYGDQRSDDAGRLLYCGQDDWCHVNCALWSAEVYEDVDGSLQNMMEAFSRGKMLKCDLCQRYGATVGCNTRGCKANYHFMCARGARCILQEDKKVFCREHIGHVDGEVLVKDRFTVLRRVFVETNRVRTVKKSWAKGLSVENIRILFGSCCIESLGRLTDLSDKGRFLEPVDFTSTRIYWSTRDARRRCVYTCRVIEVRPEQLKSPTIALKDMRIVHDKTDPDYIPLSTLDLSGIDLGVHHPAICEKGMDTVDLTGDSHNSSETMSATEDCQILTSPDISLNKTDVCNRADQVPSTSQSVSLLEKGSQKKDKINSRILSSSWPRQNEKKKKFGSEPDLSLLSPKTLKMLNIKDTQKYTGSCSGDMFDSEDDDCSLLKIANRLNRAAAKSSKTDMQQNKLHGRRASSVDRASPIGLSRAMSLDVRNVRSHSVDTVDNLKTTAVSKPLSLLGLNTSEQQKLDLPLRPFSPPLRMTSRSRSLSVDREISLSNSISSRSRIITEGDRTVLPNFTGCRVTESTVAMSRKPVAISSSLTSPEPKPVDCSSPVANKFYCDTSQETSLPSIGEADSCAESIEPTDFCNIDTNSESNSQNVDSYVTGTENSEVATETGNENSVSLSLTDESGEIQKTIVVMTDSGESLTDEEAIRIVQEVIDSGSSLEDGTQLSLTAEDEVNAEVDTVESGDGPAVTTIPCDSEGGLDVNDEANDRSDSPFVPNIDGSPVSTMSLKRIGRLNRSVNMSVDEDGEGQLIAETDDVPLEGLIKSEIRETNNVCKKLPEVVEKTDGVENEESEADNSKTISTCIIDLTGPEINEINERKEISLIEAAKEGNGGIDNTILDIEDDSDLELLYEIDDSPESDDLDKGDLSDCKMDICEEEETCKKKEVNENIDMLKSEDQIKIIDDANENSNTNSELIEKEPVFEENAGDEMVDSDVHTEIGKVATTVDDSIEQIRTVEDLHTKEKSDSDEIDGDEVKQVSNSKELKEELKLMFSATGLEGEYADKDIFLNCISVIEEEESSPVSVKYLGIDVDRKSPEIQEKHIEISPQSSQQSQNSVNSENSPEKEIRKNVDDDAVLQPRNSGKSDVNECSENSSTKLEVVENVDDERDSSEKHEVLRGLGLGTCDEVEKIKNSPPKNASPVKLYQPIHEQKLDRKRKYLQKSPLKIYPLRKSMISPVRRDDTENFMDGDGKSDDSKHESGSLKEDSTQTKLPVLDPISKKIKEESIAKSCPEEKGPFKCPSCRNLYRTETSYNAHVEICNFYVSSSEEDEINDSDDEFAINVAKCRKQVKMMRNRKKLLLMNKKKNQVTSMSEREKSDSNHIKVGEKSGEAPRSSLRTSTMNQRVAIEVEEKRMKEEILKCGVPKQRGRPSLKGSVIVDQEDVDEINASPCRSPSANQTSSQTTFEKKGRGRPRKQSVDSPETAKKALSDREMRRKSREIFKLKDEHCSDSGDNEDNTTTSPQLKRGRGRPRKAPDDEKETEPVGNSDQGKPNRGRLRKSLGEGNVKEMSDVECEVKAASGSSTHVKRGRGRPRRTFSEDNQKEMTESDNEPKDTGESPNKIKRGRGRSKLNSAEQNEDTGLPIKQEYECGSLGKRKSEMEEGKLPSTFGSKKHCSGLGDHEAGSEVSKCDSDFQSPNSEIHGKFGRKVKLRKSKRTRDSDQQNNENSDAEERMENLDKDTEKSDESFGTVLDLETGQLFENSSGKVLNHSGIDRTDDLHGRKLQDDSENTSKNMIEENEVGNPDKVQNNKVETMQMEETADEYCDRAITTASDGIHTKDTVENTGDINNKSSFEKTGDNDVAVLYTNSKRNSSEQSVKHISGLSLENPNPDSHNPGHPYHGNNNPDRHNPSQTFLGNHNPDSHNPGSHNPGNHTSQNTYPGNHNPSNHNSGSHNHGDCNQANHNPRNHTQGNHSHGNHNPGNHSHGNHNPGNHNHGNHNLHNPSNENIRKSNPGDHNPVNHIHGPSNPRNHYPGNINPGSHNPGNPEWNHNLVDHHPENQNPCYHNPVNSKPESSSLGNYSRDKHSLGDHYFGKDGQGKNYSGSQNHTRLTDQSKVVASGTQGATLVGSIGSISKADTATGASCKSQALYQSYPNSSKIRIGSSNDDIPKAVLKLLKEGHKVVIKNPKLNKSFLWQKTENGYIGKAIDQNALNFNLPQTPGSSSIAGQSTLMSVQSSGRQDGHKNINGPKNYRSIAIADKQVTDINDSEVHSDQTTGKLKTASDILAERKKALALMIQARVKACNAVSESQTSSGSVVDNTAKNTSLPANKTFSPTECGQLRAEYMCGLVIGKKTDSTLAHVHQKLDSTASVATNIVRQTLLKSNPTPSQTVVVDQSQVATYNVQPFSMPGVSVSPMVSLNVLPSMTNIPAIAVNSMQPMVTPMVPGVVTGNLSQLAQPLVQFSSSPQLLIQQGVQPRVQQTLESAPFPQFAQTGQHTLTGAQTVLGYNLQSLQNQTSVFQQNLQQQVSIGTQQIASIPQILKPPRIHSSPNILSHSQVIGNTVHSFATSIQPQTVPSPSSQFTTATPSMIPAIRTVLPPQARVSSQAIITTSSSSSSSMSVPVTNPLPGPRSVKYESMKKFLMQRALMPMSKPVAISADKVANKMMKGLSVKRGRKPGYQKAKNKGLLGSPERMKPGKRKEKLHWKRSLREQKEAIASPHSIDKASHPIIHPQKEVTSLPAAAVEMEVRDIPLSDMAEAENGSSGAAEKQNLGHVEYEIISDDGFSCRSDSLDGAWRQVTEKVQDARAASRLKQLSFSGLSSQQMFGFSQPSVMYHVEQLYGANYCRKHKFKYHKHELAEHQLELVNPSGSIRTEAYGGRNPWDMFSFLLSRYRMMPQRQERGGQDEEMVLKSSRRATSMDLPMAMRFRKLKEHSKEAVGVYRSLIHGRGLFCKRNIDGGEMIIEYSGELIRNSMTDIREKYYESRGIGCYMFRIDDIDVVDATMKGSAARFINHSCEPNCYSKVITVDNRKHIVIFAMRPISRGEELTYDYKFPIEEVKIPCTCGSKKCRKYLN